MIDALTRLCGAGQSLTGITTAGVISTNWIDLFTNPPVPNLLYNTNSRALGGGQLVVAKFAFPVALDSATENATIDLQIVGLPVTTDQPFTTGFANDTAVDPTTDRITFANTVAIYDGMRITISTAGTFPTVGSGPALAANTSYYLRNPHPPTGQFPFTAQLSRTPSGPIIDITADGTGSTTVTFFPEVIVAKQNVGLDYCSPAEGVIEVGIPPLWITKQHQGPRYLFARFIPSATLGSPGGTVTCDLVGGYQQDGRPFNLVGYVTQ